jgi:hypothetical protein
MLGATPHLSSPRFSGLLRRNPNTGFLLPAQVIQQSHAAGGISLRGVNATVGRTRPYRQNGPSFRRRLVDPIAAGDWLTGPSVRAKRRPISFRLVFLVRDGTFDYQDERREIPRSRVSKETCKLLAIFIGEKRVMESYFRNPGESSQHQVFNTRLRRWDEVAGRGFYPILLRSAAGSDPLPNLLFFSDIFIPYRAVCTNILSQ